MKKVKRMLVSFGMAMTMMLNLSAVSYAVQLPQPQLPLSLMIGQTAPVSMEQSQYSLQLSQAQVKHTEAIAQLLSLPQQTEKLEDMDELRFFPGDILYIPIVNRLTGELYTQKSRPSNWAIETTGIDPQVISQVRWANETGSLNVAVDFVATLPQSKDIPMYGQLALYDEQSRTSSEWLPLEFTFGNAIKEVQPRGITEVSSPMNLHAGQIYQGEEVILSFGGNVYFKDAVLQPGQTIYLDLDCSFDSQIANRYKAFDIQCYRFNGDEDSFSQPGRVCLPVQRTDSYVYEVVNGELKALQTQVDEDSGLLCFYAESLGYYIVSPSLMG